MSDTVILTRQEYQDLIDVRDGMIALSKIARGEMETLSEAEVDAYLAAPTPLSFWRRHRKLTQAGLAAEAGISQAFLAQIEKGKRVGAVDVLAKIAKALRVRIEDLVAE